MHHLILESEVCITAVGMAIISIHTCTKHPSHIHTEKTIAHVQRGLTPCPLAMITQQHGSDRLLSSYAHDGD